MAKIPIEVYIFDPNNEPRARQVFPKEKSWDEAESLRRDGRLAIPDVLGFFDVQKQRFRFSTAYWVQESPFRVGSKWNPATDVVDRDECTKLVAAVEQQYGYSLRHNERVKSRKAITVLVGALEEDHFKQIANRQGERSKSKRSARH